jgi:hypothetical protein
MAHPKSSINHGGKRAARIRNGETAMARKDEKAKGPLLPADTDPRRFGREPETGLRHEALEREAVAAENERRAGLQRNADARARAVDEFEDSQAIEDKSHGGVSVVQPPARTNVAEPGEQAVADIEDRDRLALDEGVAAGRPARTEPSAADVAASKAADRIEAERKGGKAKK